MRAGQYLAAGGIALILATANMSARADTTDVKAWDVLRIEKTGRIAPTIPTA